MDKKIKEAIKANKKRVSKTSPDYRRKRHNPRDAIAAFRSMHMLGAGDDYEEIVEHKGTQIIKTRFYQASWSTVFALALINSVGVMLARIVIFEEIGKPKTYSEALEEHYGRPISHYEIDTN